MDKFKMIFCVFMMNFCSFLGHFFLMFFSLFYFFGAIFWKEETFDRMMDKIYKQTQEL